MRLGTERALITVSLLVVQHFYSNMKSALSAAFVHTPLCSRHAVINLWALVGTVTFHVHASSYSVRTYSPSNSSQAPCQPPALWSAGYHSSHTPMLQRMCSCSSGCEAVCVCVWSSWFSPSDYLSHWVSSFPAICVCVCAMLITHIVGTSISYTVALWGTVFLMGTKSRS